MMERRGNYCILGHIFWHLCCTPCCSNSGFSTEKLSAITFKGGLLVAAFKRGRPGIAVSQASQALHLFLHDHRSRKQPAAVNFVDIRNAFYRLFRQHIVRGSELHEAVHTLFEELELPEATFEEFRCHHGDAGCGYADLLAIADPRCTEC